MEPVGIGEPHLAERLDALDRSRLREARRRLRLLAARSECFTEAARTLRELTGADLAAIYTRAASGELATIGHTFNANGWLECVRAHVPRAAVYRLHGTDDFGNAAVCDATLYRNSGPQELERKQEVFRAFGYARQLRVALYQRERFHLYMGVFNVSPEAKFDTRQALLLAAASRTFGRTRRLAQRFKAQPLASIDAILDRINQPVVVLDERGRAVHVNRAAAQSGAHAGPWVEQLLHDPDSMEQFADLLHVDGYDVVVGRSAIAPDQLPESLRTVATLAIAGKSDKEIAHTLDRPIATVRTYMQRIYTRLGVHSRVELASKLR